MGKLEAQALIENSGNYDEEETEEIINIYDILEKNIGFEDNRADSRFIVKFHDIFYFMPYEYYKENSDVINSLFEDFCATEYDCIIDELETKHIDIDYMLTQHDVGHYRAFLVDIPEINKDNILDLATDIFYEFRYEGREYVVNYIETVNALQDLENNYMEYWFDFIEDAIPEEILKQMKKDYKEYKERKNSETVHK